MGKKIRETILLLVLFVFTILILELTGIREKEIENQVQIPKSCNILIRIDIQGLSKKIVLSELYSNRAPELIQNLLEMNNQETTMILIMFTINLLINLMILVVH